MPINRRHFLAGLVSVASAAPVIRQGKQLEVAISASADQVTAGQHVTLTLDVVLKPRMHVYAPGVEHYIAVDWQMTESEAAKAQPAKWPKSKMLHLDAIDETVPVYQDSFQVVRDVVIAPSAKGEIAIHGVLKYQACDDKMCFIPSSVPLDWTFHVTSGRK